MADATSPGLADEGQQCLAYVCDRWRAEQNERVRPVRGGGERHWIAVVEGDPLDVTRQHPAARDSGRGPQRVREARGRGTRAHLPADVSRSTGDEYVGHDLLRGSSAARAPGHRAPVRARRASARAHVLSGPLANDVPPRCALYACASSVDSNACARAPAGARAPPGAAPIALRRAGEGARRVPQISASSGCDRACPERTRRSSRQDRRPSSTAPRARRAAAARRRHPWPRAPCRGRRDRRS